MGATPLLLRADLGDELARFLEPRAAAVDAGTASLREGLQFVEQTVFGPAPDGRGTLLRTAQTLATVARLDMSTAFALWCHRMVLEYLRHAAPGSPLHAEVLPRLRRTELLGSTALAGAMAYFVAGTPLSVTWHREGADLVLDGRVQWASNLCPEGFVQVVAAAGVDGAEPLVFALSSRTPGLQAAAYPTLLALQTTQSASVLFQGARVSEAAVLTRQFATFMRRIRPPFLVLQSSFCWGLAHRALTEARAALRPATEVFRPDLVELETRAARLGEALACRAAHDGAADADRELVQMRLDSAYLATHAVALEVKIVGGRAYTQPHPTNRRLREAAFLPIQAPTEGQLRAELARAAAAAAPGR